MHKEVGSIALDLIPDAEGLDLVVSYEVGDPEPWIGVASFPWEMQDEAELWMDRIESENDLEDLFRQWAPEETWWAFQRVRNLVGV
jgi:hypothetical protein